MSDTLFERTVDGIYVSDDAASDDVETTEESGWTFACRMAS